MTHSDVSDAPIPPSAIESLRDCFPGLQRIEGGQTCVFLDGPAGTQVPSAVAEAVSKHLLHHNANHGGMFSTSRESDAIVDEAHRAAAEFVGANLVGASDGGEIAFGVSRMDQP
jgi:selenocysteine lyase/cysteine desulfurase